MYPSSTHEWYMQSLFFPDGVGWNLVGIPDFPAGRGFMDFVRRPGLAGSLNKHYSNGGPCFPSTPHWQSGDILHGSFLRTRFDFGNSNSGYMVTSDLCPFSFPSSFSSLENFLLSATLI